MKNDPAIKLTAASFGFSAGIFFAGYAIMQLPMVQVLQYVGARRVLGSLLVIWGLIASATGAISSVWALCVLRFLLGVAEAIVSMVTVETPLFARRANKRGSIASRGVAMMKT